MTRDVVSVERSLGRIERLRDGVDRELGPGHAGLAGLSWGVGRLATIVIWSAKTSRSFRAELCCAVRSVDVLRIALTFDETARAFVIRDGLTAKGQA